MTTTTRQPVTFNVPQPSPIKDIPAGTYAGYVEFMSIPMRGEVITQLGRAMLHLDRNEHPELFSPKNSMVAIDVDVTPHVSKGEISYQ